MMSRAPAPIGRIALRVSPGGSRTEWMGRMADGRLKIRVGAIPEDGRANRELVAFVARSLAVPASRVRIVSGAASRDKVLEVEADAESVRRLQESGGGPGVPRRGKTE